MKKMKPNLKMATKTTTKKEKPTKITEFQEDALKEVGNIGAGKASSALAKMTGKTIFIEMTRVKMMPIKEVDSLVGGPTIPAVGILFEISGDLPGLIVLLSSKVTSLQLLDLMKRQRSGMTKSIGEEETDTLKEVGNILVGSYLAGLSDFTGMNLLESVPKIIVNNVPSIMKEVVKTYDHQINYVLVIDTQLKIEGQKFTNELVFVLKSESFDLLFNVLMKKLTDKEDEN